MKYDGVIIKPPLTEDTLQHWGIRGWTKKNHKYTRRERGKNGKWKYFYGQLKSRTRKITDKIDYDHDWLIDVFDKNITRNRSALSNDPRYTKSKTSDNQRQESAMKNDPRYTEKIYKYYKKIRTANGKIRYFYSEAEYNRYMGRINVLDKDYQFMQDVPVLPSKPSADNTVRKADVGTTAGNCSSCSIAFELRMRGYDVQSRPDINGATRDEIVGAFDNLEYNTANNWYLDTSRDENKRYYNKGISELFRPTSEEERLQVAQNDLERAIKERGGNDQRGFIHIGWTKSDPDEETGKRHSAGGAHVFNYVVEGGQVRYYDAQKGETNGQMGQEIDIKTYLDNTDYLAHVSASDGGYATYMSFERVDNKNLNEHAKEFIQYTPVEIHDEPEKITKNRSARK